MSRLSLMDRLDAFHAWQENRLRLLEKLHNWLKQQDLLSPEAGTTIDDAQRALRNKHITIAVVGEFSRGKTELINALFFADQGGRLLPSSPGRTTMCPTEIFCDPDQSPFIRLLPIESRLDIRSLHEIMEDEDQWQREMLDTDSVEGMAQQCMTLTDNIRVNRSDADIYGLLSEAQSEDPEDSVEIPRWRMAQINLHHPLLKMGLRILDTPGLNAVGTEPELTYQMLPSAHAVLFVLGADTGVTQTDLQIWRQISRPTGAGTNDQTLVVLNKTDTLWDELRSAQEIAGSIISQCQETARLLDVTPDKVYATSAQKALLAQIKPDEALWRRTGIGDLQRHLSDTIAANRKVILEQSNTRMLLETIGTIESLIANRIEQNRQQQKVLLALTEESNEAVRTRLLETQREFANYQADTENHRRNIGEFRRRTRNVLAALDPDSLEAALDDLRRRMSEAWTTHGLKIAMQSLLDEIDIRIARATRETRKMRRKLRMVQDSFRGDSRWMVNVPPMFSLVRHQVALRLLEDEAETFRNSRRATLMEQRFVVKHYFTTIVARAQQIIQAAYDEADHWSTAAISPFEDASQQYRTMLAERIDRLQQTGQSRRTVHKRISVLKHDNQRLRTQAKTLRTVRKALASKGFSTPARSAPASTDANSEAGSSGG